MALVLVVMMLGETGQQDRGERDAEERAGKLHQPVRVGNPGDAAVTEIRGELRVDQHRDLRRRHSEDRGAHRREYPPHARIAPVEPRARQHPQAHQRADLQRELQDAADGHTPRERHDRRIDMRRDEHGRADDRQVEDDGRKRRNREFAVNV